MGNIVIVKFNKETRKNEKLKFAKKLLSEHKNIKTILEKVEKVKGRLRKIKTSWIAGQMTKEVLYRENNCIFRFNVDSCYFSPRLANERLEIAKKIKKKDKVLVLFSGTGPYAIVIAKLTGARVTAIEISKECNKYARENVKLNKLQNVELIQGDVKKVARKLKEKFDVIVMPRPQLKNTFLKEAFSVAKKGTIIFYYDFAKIEDKDKIIEKIKEEAVKARKKIKIIGMKRAGELAPYKFRWRVDFKIV